MDQVTHQVEGWWNTNAVTRSRSGAFRSTWLFKIMLKVGIAMVTVVVCQSCTSVLLPAVNVLA
jgi:hypothetical protein